MIVDTSAWIDYIRANGSHAHLRLRRAMQRKEALWIPAVVLQEVLQGARSPDHYLALQRDLDRLPAYEPEDVRELHRAAAMLYARCRWQGFTVRSPNDCVVAACAIAAGMPVLAQDRDFESLARVEPGLQLV